MRRERERERERAGEKESGKRERVFFGDTAIFKPLVYVVTLCVYCSSVSVVVATQYGVGSSCFKLS
jgi:hypothetical protein